MATVPSAPAVASKRCVRWTQCTASSYFVWCNHKRWEQRPLRKSKLLTYPSWHPVTRQWPRVGSMQTDVTAAAWSPLSAPTNLPDAKSISRAQPSTWPVATSCMILWQHTEVTAGCLAVAPSGRPAEPAASCPSAPRLLPTAGPQPGGKDPPPAGGVSSKMRAPRCTSKTTTRDEAKPPSSLAASLGTQATHTGTSSGARSEGGDPEARPPMSPPVPGRYMARNASMALASRPWCSDSVHQRPMRPSALALARYARCGCCWRFQTTSLCPTSNPACRDFCCAVRLVP
mmetsp:Transcript_134174/g.373953  ORF Transcript_134174/g.373953 Transcript_134174/m.373953 type:complete len:287 (+) Transcript_134174:140-1000(+)